MVGSEANIHSRYQGAGFCVSILISDPGSHAIRRISRLLDLIYLSPSSTFFFLFPSSLQITSPRSQKYPGMTLI